MSAFSLRSYPPLVHLISSEPSRAFRHIISIVVIVVPELALSLVVRPHHSPPQTRAPHTRVLYAPSQTSPAYFPNF